MLTVTRKQQLLEAFRAAGRRGLTASEMQAEVGVMWRLRLRELKLDGCIFCEYRSRRGGTLPFRWSLVLEPAPPPVAGDERLLDPPPAPPGNALFGSDPE